MSQPGEDDPMHVGDVQAKRQSDKDNAATRPSDARHMSQSQPTKKTFIFALKPMSTPPFVYSTICDEGVKLVVDMKPSGLGFEKVLESNIRKAVENFKFESFRGEIQLEETNEENVLGSNAMAVPMTLEENKTCPQAREDVIETHDFGSHHAPEIPLMQISGSDFQKKGMSVSSCNSSVEAMATENVAGASISEVNSSRLCQLTSEEAGGRVNDQKALTEMENYSDAACKAKKQGKGYLKRNNKKKNKKLCLKRSSSKEVHDPKDKSSKNAAK